MAKKLKEKQPQYILSGLNTPMLNYRVYVMKPSETLLYFLLGLLSGGVVGLIFYGNQFLDEDGIATTATTLCNIILFLGIGTIAGIFFLPICREQLKKKRRAVLTKQFRSLLDTLAVSLSSGMNMSDALGSAYRDLRIEYSEDAYIVAEVEEMIQGAANNIPIEEMMKSLGERSEIEDIRNFGIVFSTAYRAGGNLKDIVRRTNEIISEKIEINAEIETTLTSNKTQFYAMMAIPVVIVLMLRSMSSSFAASFSTAAGIVAMTVAIAIFFGAFKLGQRIMDVKG